MMRRSWAVETAANPSVLRIHVAHQLTDRTIVTSPPAELAMPIAGLLELEAVRTIDLHRYRIRVNLSPSGDREATVEHVRQILEPAWGADATLEADPEPRAFEAAHRADRVVAESAEMAQGEPVLEALFRIEGVSEAIAGDGLVLVRLGPLFSWSTAEPEIAAAVGTYERNSRDGMP
jgi:hypothetical protein